jgi:hypothetical protein
VVVGVVLGGGGAGGKLKLAFKPQLLTSVANRIPLIKSLIMAGSLA